MFELRVLGPLELLVTGRTARLAPQQRVLLLGLLLSEGGVLTVGRLGEILWEQTPRRAGGAPCGATCTIFERPWMAPAGPAAH
ncbi:MAG: hypothetical protein J2P29_11680 [Actinobacteria bacterium]|nr:hypothetical protein [Actinomycetota bacterium]